VSCTLLRPSASLSAEHNAELSWRLAKPVVNSPSTVSKSDAPVVNQPRNNASGVPVFKALRDAADFEQRIDPRNILSDKQ